ncbi:MAG: addiction module protein [Burkholderiales bacterium]
MSKVLADIEKEIARLTIEERARLIQHLIESLEPADEDKVDAEWERELLRRSKDIEEGTAVGTPAEEVLDRIHRDLR